MREVSFDYGKRTICQPRTVLVVSLEREEIAEWLTSKGAARVDRDGDLWLLPGGYAFAVKDGVESLSGSSLPGNTAPSLDPLREALGTWVDNHGGSTDEGVIKAAAQRLKVYEQQLEDYRAALDKLGAAVIEKTANEMAGLVAKEDLHRTFADRMDRELDQKYGKAQVCVDNGWD